ncbi:HAD-IA family hydrolase [Alteriqipengyuania lutimaris]|uniref:HAD family hydrolase n=1 Tax=Alteriqipengyuania lutimaris TaxID=1538146 RepID=A0A395LKG4_9SPHN|nr:HAD-IA family hydrolase [Alteriqipengyuania lutimaris]MBB3033479.1 phosphoglycolate phosphatase [Alteriqipengyuania lutimaris]RDS77506.1 HAD family hydrolase [Alteriqipengyuania lutimaris]
MRCAVFDCDGTLVDGQAAVCDSMVAAFAQAGLPAPDRNAVRRIVGLSLPQAVVQLAPDAAQEQATAVVESYKASFRATRERGALQEPLYAGIRETLRALRGADWSLAVATGKSDRGLRATIATHGLEDLFDSLQGADRHPSKPHPAMLEAALVECVATPADAVMIGDTSFDIEMAKAAGVRAIGVAWGYHEPEELLHAGADIVAQTPAHLTEILLGE